jgi:hypothetical protein
MMGLKQAPSSHKVAAMSKHPADGQHVVVQGNERLTGVMNEEQARQEAERLRKLQESQGKQQEGEQPRVVQNLYG